MPGLLMPEQNLTCAAWARLPERQSGLIQMIADGLTNQRIGARVGFTEDTIKRVVSDVISRWEARDRTNLVYRACVRGDLVAGRRRCAQGELTVDEYEQERNLLAGLLTPQQTVILPLIAEGLTNHAIGRRLGISEVTVKTHVKRALPRLKARERSNLVYLACKHGLLPLGDADA
jgi:DNA-binding NarL/FixJ family response regulator